MLAWRAVFKEQPIGREHAIKITALYEIQTLPSVTMSIADGAISARIRLVSAWNTYVFILQRLATSKSGLTIKNNWVLGDLGEFRNLCGNFGP